MLAYTLLVLLSALIITLLNTRCKCELKVEETVAEDEFHPCPARHVGPAVPARPRPVAPAPPRPAAPAPPRPAAPTPPRPVAPTRDV